MQAAATTRTCSNPGGDTTNTFVLAADAFYEVDLFGRIRRSTEAAQADLFASEANRQTVVTAVIADVAATYFLLRDLDARYRDRRAHAEAPASHSTRHHPRALQQRHRARCWM